MEWLENGKRKVEKIVVNFEHDKFRAYTAFSLIQS